MIVPSDAEWTPRVSVTAPSKMVYELEFQAILDDDMDTRLVNFRVWRDYEALVEDSTHIVGKPTISGHVKWDGCANFDDDYSDHICDISFIEDRLHTWKAVEPGIVKAPHTGGGQYDKLAHTEEFNRLKREDRSAAGVYYHHFQAHIMREQYEAEMAAREAAKRTEPKVDTPHLDEANRLKSEGHPLLAAVYRQNHWLPISREERAIEEANAAAEVRE